MLKTLKPLPTKKMKKVFIARFEELILSGKLARGQKLPSERELALQLQVGRPVVHAGLTDLALKGLISMKPKAVAVVNDYTKRGSLTLLNSLLRYHHGNIDPVLLQSLIDMRMLFELETIKQAALNRSDADILIFEGVLKNESTADRYDVNTLAELDFSFHHQIALSGGNIVYPLLLNSFKSIYKNVTRQFFSDVDVIEIVFDFHKQIVSAIKDKEVFLAVDLMKKLLEHGEANLAL